MIVDFILYVIITTCTGTLAFLVWLLLEKLFDRHHMEYAIYHTVKVVVILYLFPLVSILIYMKNRIGYVDGSFRGSIGLQTPVIQCVYYVLFVVWLIGFVFNLVCYIQKERLWRAIENTSVEADGEVQEILQRLKAKMGIERKIEVYVGEEVISPYTRGIIRIRILLPAYLINPKDQEYALMHELTHCKDYDTIILFFMILAQMIHWYNPMIWKLQKNLRGWMEIFTDNRIIYHYGMGMGYARFFCRLIEILGSMVDPLYLGLRSSANITKQRVERIMTFEAEIEIKRGMAVVWSAGLCILACLSILVAVEGIDCTYDFIYETTVVTVEEEMGAVEAVTTVTQFETMKLVEDMNTMYGKMIDISNEEIQGYAFKSTFPIHTRLQSDSFYLEEGQKIDFDIATETEFVTIRFQIVNEENMAYYTDIQVDVVGLSRCTFLCEQSGNYRVYVENISDVDAEISGGCWLIKN